MSKKPPSIEEFALEAEADYDPYASRRKLDGQKYAELAAEIVRFAELRASGKLGLSFKWFIRTGIPKLNAARAAQGLDPLPDPPAESTILQWMEKRHPELRKHFER